MQATVPCTNLALGVRNGEVRAHILNLRAFEPCFCNHLHRRPIRSVKHQHTAREGVCHTLHKSFDLLGQEVIEHAGVKVYRAAGGIDLGEPFGIVQIAGDVFLPLSGGAVFFASGVFYYFLTEQVKALVQGMADAFPGGVLVFDAANRAAVKMIAKTWLKSAKIKDVGAYFAVSDAPKEINAWSSHLQVTSRGYMLGYNDLKDPSVSRFFRFLARVGDGVMKMQIVRIKFGGR